MSTRIKIQALIEGTARGKAALAGGYGEKAAARELARAIDELSDGVPAEFADELQEGFAVLLKLQARLGRLDDATVRAIRPCPSCQSTELLLADRCVIDELVLTVIVCPQCGDSRLWCPAPAELRKATRRVLGEPIFRAITVPGTEAGPFR